MRVGSRRPSRRAGLAAAVCAFLAISGGATPASPSSAPLGGVQSLSAPGHYDKYPSAVFDRSGTLWIAYTSNDRGRDSVVVRGKAAAGDAWTPEERLAAGEGTESGARLVVDGNGTLWVFWHGRRQGMWTIYSRRREGGAWSAEERVSAAGVNALHAAATADSSGRLWVAWEIARPRGFGIELVTREGNGWSAPAAVASAGSDRRPALAAPPDGGVFLAWDSTRAGSYDIWLARARAGKRGAPLLESIVPVTADAGIDDSPSIACAGDGTLWLAWNSMRGHAAEAFRADRHSGDAFLRAFRNGKWWAPPGAARGALPGQVSWGAVNKTPRDAVEPYWQWKQTQNYPSVFLDSRGRAWVIWRTDATGAHNFDLWARIHDGARWSPELHLTTFSPGRDEFPSVAAAPDGRLQIAWEGQALPAEGQAPESAGDVDAYDTRGSPNVVLTGRLEAPDQGWVAAPLAPAPPERYRAAEANELLTPGPPPGSATAGNGRWHVYFGDPHSHSILSDAKTGLPDQLMELSRDRLGLDFDVVSDHTEMGRLQASEYAELQLTSRVFDEPGRFVSLTGWEWTAGSAYGHRVVLHRDDGGPILSSAEPEGDTIEKLYAHLREHHGIVSPHHTGNATWGRWNPGAPFDESLEPNFEIASWHGRYEFFGNPREGRRQVPGHQYQDALRLGRHVGVMGASDTHHLSPGEGGLTAVLAERLDRESLFDAIRNRRNYATTGARIVLEFTAAGAPMGSRIHGHGPVPMTVRVEGTAAIDRIEIVRNLIDTFAAVRLEQAPGAADGVFLIYEPSDPQGGRRLEVPDTRIVTFTVEDKAPPPGETSYYVRVTQADGHQAWSSPIWVDSSSD
ncbi:MAG: CehA/McbA family metallohydrolase [Acidobacteria bacterium]|nr:CehA/McbA family metallohydrolase [Acidobacteriota bacterium]MCA1610511.1 CehA/McbA family metallohydrolase [Acidobacteriota bacterium]